MNTQVNASVNIAVEKFLTPSTLVTFPWMMEGELHHTQGWVLKINSGPQTKAGDARLHEAQAPCSPDGALKTTLLTPLTMEEVNTLLERVGKSVLEKGTSPYEYVDNAHHWSTDGKCFLSRFFSPWYDETRPDNSEGFPEVWFLDLENVLETYTEIQKQGALRMVLHKEDTDWAGYLERIQRLGWFGEYAREKGWGNQMIITQSEDTFIVHNLGVVSHWEVAYLSGRAWESMADLVARHHSERTSSLVFEILDNVGEVITYRHFNV